MKDELEQLLNRSRAEGRLESSSEIEINLEKAAEKLRLNASNSDYWLLRWTQGSVCANASRIEGKRGRGETILTNDAEPLSENELLALADPTTALASDDRRLWHCGAAFLSALGGNPIHVEVGCHRDGQSLVLTIENGKPVIKRDGRSNHANNWIKRSIEASGWLGKLRDALFTNLLVIGLTPAHRSFLQKRVRHCPIPFLWNGVPMNAPLHGGGTNLQGENLTIFCGGEMDGGLYLLGNNAETGSIPGFSMAHGRSLVWLREVDDGDWETLHRTSRSLFDLTRTKAITLPSARNLPGMVSDGIPLIACRASMQKTPPTRNANIDLVVDGVCYKSRTLKGVKGARFVLAASNLQTDLGGIDIIENDAYQELMELARALHARWIKEKKGQT